jgi:hypothetical protein
VFHRARWLGVGAALGFGASVWAQHKLKEVSARYRPAGLAGNAANKARSWPSHFRAAIEEGRSTMRAREAELRDGLVRPPSASEAGLGREGARLSTRAGKVREPGEHRPTTAAPDVTGLQGNRRPTYSRKVTRREKDRPA